VELIEGEKVLFRSRLSLWCLSKQLALGIVLVPVGIGMLILSWVYAKWKSVEVVVTDRRVTWSIGIVTKDVVDMLLERIESVDVTRGPWGRMLGYGTVQITGTGSSHEPLVGVRDPMGLRKAVIQAQSTAARTLRAGQPAQVR
jgi:membrane protein YdbS with pleckstrin-like domain